MNDQPEPLAQYSVLGPDKGESGTARIRWWNRKSVYLSDVCLAVHLEPRSSPRLSGEDLSLAKDSLYAYLRSIAHSAMELDLMRPVACVITDSHATGLNAWAADQDWHRGSFTLYVEDNEIQAADRLKDLLDPTVKQLTEQREEKRDRMQEIKDKFGHDPLSGTAGQLAEALLARMDAVPKEKPKAGEWAAPIQEWESEITRKARSTAEGQGQP